MPEDDFRCKTCNETFKTREEYLQHRQLPCGTGVVTDPVPDKLQCPECWKKGKTFKAKNEAGLGVHRSLIHGVMGAKMEPKERIKWFKKMVRKGVLTRESIKAQGYDFVTGLKLADMPPEGTTVAEPAAVSEVPPVVEPKKEPVMPKPPAPAIWDNKPVKAKPPEVKVRVIIKFCQKCGTLWDCNSDIKFCQDCGGELQSPKRRKTVAVEEQSG